MKDFQRYDLIMVFAIAIGFIAGMLMDNYIILSAFLFGLAFGLIFAWVLKHVENKEGK